MTLHKLKNLVLYLLYVNFILRRSEASDITPKIGTLLTEPSFDGGYDSKESPLLNSNLRKGKNFDIELESEEFRCDFKRGYFADVDSGCQVFHICTPMSAHYKFKCPPGTLFNQRYLVCDWPYNVDCIGSERFFSNNAYQDSTIAYDGFGAISKELQETPKPLSNLVQRSIVSNTPRKEPTNQSLNTNEAHPENFLVPKHQFTVSGPFRSETRKGLTQNSVPPDAARSLPPKIIFTYTSDPNPEISIPQLLKDIQSREESQRAKSGQKNGDSHFSVPTLSQINNVSNQPESDLKNLPKRQIATILSTLKKLNDYPDNDFIPKDKQSEAKIQQSHFSFQNVNFGKTTPTKSPDVINKSKVSTHKDREQHNRRSTHSENFVPVTANYLTSSSPSNPINKISSIQLQRVNNGFSPLREVNKQNTLKVVELPSRDVLVNPQPVYHFSEYQSGGEKSFLLQKDSTRAPKPSLNRTQRLNIRKEKKLSGASFSSFPQEENTSLRVNERNLSSLPVKIQPNFSVNIGKAKSSIQNQLDENRSTTGSYNNFHHQIKENGPSSTDDWSIKTVDTYNSRDEIKIPTPVTEFPDIPLYELTPNSYSTGQSNDNLASENVSTAYKLASEKFTTLSSRKRSTESQPKHSVVGETVYGTQTLESREIQPINREFHFSPIYSSADEEVFDGNDLSSRTISVLDILPPTNSNIPSSHSIKTENENSSLTEYSANYHSDKSGFFNASSPVSKSPLKLRRNRLLNITNNDTNISPKTEMSKAKMKSMSLNVSEHQPVDVKEFFVIPDLQVVSELHNFDVVKTNRPVNTFESKSGYKYLKNLNSDTIDSITASELLQIPDSEKVSASLAKQQSLKIRTLTSSGKSLTRTRKVSASAEEPLARTLNISNSLRKQLPFKWKNLSTEDVLPLPQNMTKIMQINRRRILKEIIKNRIKDFETEESEIKRSKLTRKTPWVVNRLKKLKSTPVVEANIGRRNSLKINLNNDAPNFVTKNLTDANSIPLSGNEITNGDLLSLKQTNLIGSHNSSVNLFSNEYRKTSSLPVNEFEELPEFLEFGTKID